MCVLFFSISFKIQLDLCPNSLFYWFNTVKYFSKVKPTIAFLYMSGDNNVNLRREGIEL